MNTYSSKGCKNFNKEIIGNLEFSDKIINLSFLCEIWMSQGYKKACLPAGA